MGLFYWDKVKSIVYDEVVGVDANEWVVVAAKQLESPVDITSVICSGNIFAEFGLFLNQTKIATKRSGPDRNAEFFFSPPLHFDRDSLVEIKAIHYRMDETGRFEAGLFGLN